MTAARSSPHVAISVVTVSASTHAIRAGHTRAPSVSATSETAACTPCTIWPTGPSEGSTGSTSVTSLVASATATAPSGSNDATTSGVAPPADAASAIRRTAGVPSASARADAGLAARMTAATVMERGPPAVPAVYRGPGTFRPRPGVLSVTPARPVGARWPCEERGATAEQSARPEEEPLPTALGLVPAVLKRSRADWPIVLASWLLLSCALALLAAGTLYTDAV